MTESVFPSLSEGDTVTLDRYIKSPLTVVERRMTRRGPVLIVGSTGGSRYRLRAIDDGDERLLLEKDRPEGWSPHLRVEVERAGGDA